MMSNGGTATSVSIDIFTIALILGFAILLFVKAIRVVPEYQRIVIFRLGRALGAKGPGLVLLIPFVDRGVIADLRERFFDVPPQTTITSDNAHLTIDFLVYSKIVDALSSVLNVEKYEGASRGIAITTLRAVVGSMLLDDVLAKRETINDTLRGKLDEVTNRWGIKVTAVEIREISVVRDIHEAMTRQMSAERTRRAMVTEADGRREATIRVAEGQKQAAILEAEGARQAALLRAQGYSSALDAIFEVARTIDDKTMSLQYLEMLKALGQNAATKLVIPLELAGLARPFVEHITKASAASSEGGGHEEAAGAGESRH